MTEKMINFISTESLSVDIFKGERKIAIISDDIYDIQKNIKGEYGSKLYNVNQDVDVSGISLVVGLGGEQAIAKAKSISCAFNLPVTIIPTYPTISAFLPYCIDDNFDVSLPAFAPTVLLVADLLNNQPREKMGLGLGTLSAFCISLVDQSFDDFLSGNDCRGAQTLKKIGEVLKNPLEYSMPFKTFGENLAKTLVELSEMLVGEYFSPLIGAHLFSLYNGQKMSYNECIFAISYAIYAAINCFNPCCNLLLPPERVKTISRLKKLLPNVKIRQSLLAKEYALINFVLSDRLQDIKQALSGFPLLAKSFLRLYGVSGFEYISKFTASDLFNIMPHIAELAASGNCIINHIYINSFFG